MILKSLTTACPLVDPEEARPTVPGVRAANHPGPQPDPLPPGERVDPQVARHHRHIQVVPPLRLDVHVATEDLVKRKSYRLTYPRALSTG